MHYDAQINDHGLPIDPLKGLVVPRPIGWISSLSSDGIANLAPYSFFNCISDNPAYVLFSSNGRKDSLRNIEETGEFVCNLVSYDLREAMNETSKPVASSVDEFELAGLEKAASRFVAPPRVKNALAALECRYSQTINLPGHNLGDGGYGVVIGKVVGVYIDDSIIVEGRVRPALMKPVSRLGYADYAVTEEVFRMKRPE